MRTFRLGPGETAAPVPLLDETNTTQVGMSQGKQLEYRRKGLEHHIQDACCAASIYRQSRHVFGSFIKGWNGKLRNCPPNVDRAVWTLAAKMDDGASWHKGVLQGAEKFMASWHKKEEEASRRRATKRDSRDLEPPTHL